jgi:hypothetical protein
MMNAESDHDGDTTMNAPETQEMLQGWQSRFWYTPATLTSSCIYAHSDNLEQIQQGFTALLAREGFQPIPPPSPEVCRAFLYDETDTLRPDWRNNLVTVALLPGTAGWTIVQTNPEELLCNPGPGIHPLRIAELASMIRAEIFMYDVYGNHSPVLIEADAQGHVALSGGEENAVDVREYPPDERPPEPLNVMIPDENRRLCFRLLPVSQALQDAVNGLKVTDDDMSEGLFEEQKVARLLAGPNVECWRNMMSRVEGTEYISDVAGARMFYFQHESIPPIILSPEFKAN